MNLSRPLFRPLLLLLLSCWLCLALPTVARAQGRFELRSTATVLPTTVMPTRVDVELDLDPEHERFSGEVHMRLQAREAVPHITLHAVQLQADGAWLLSGAGRRVLQVQPDEASGTWRLLPADGRPIARGSHRLHIRYRGRVQTAGEGLYRADHRVQGRPARWLATQLQAVQARTVLPVFDEPVFRSVFRLAVRAPQGFEVLSNMPRTSARAQGGSVRHVFAPTPPMPAYLLAVAVGRFDVLEGRSGRIPLRLFTAPGKREQARLALQATQQVLPFYARYFGRPYALPKLDQLAVPGTRQGAMEDWGLISYVEDGLLYDPARSDPRTQRGVFGLVAHEVAHQWFGNLVSVASWSEIWLNEAFATWMANKATQHFHPEWQSALRERGDLARVMARDATPATRAIRAGPVSESSVFEVFDDVTYVKGGAVLSMIEQWIGEDAFQRGLAAYMAERALKPATAADLWFHIGRATGQPVADVAASWTNQPGVPLLGVDAACEGGNTVVTLRQSRFSAGEPLPEALWRLPVRLARGDEQRQVMLDQREQTLNWPGCSALPLRANAGGRGYYVVDYAAPLRRALVAGFAALPLADRVTLVADSFALARAGRLGMAEHLALLGALPQVHDASRAPLFTLAEGHWRLLDGALHGTPAQAPLREAGRALFGPELQRLGWQAAAGEDNETHSQRGRLVRLLALLDDPGTVQAARQRLPAALAGQGGLEASLRGPVMAAVGRHATADEFEALLAALRRSDSEEDRWQLMHALAIGQDAERAQRLLQESLAGSLPPSQAVELPGMVGESPALSALAYDFVVQNWPALSRLAGEGPFGGRNWLLPAALQGSAEPADARRLLQDQRRLAGANGASTAERIAADIQARHRLREREAAPLADLLRGWRPQAQGR